LKFDDALSLTHNATDLILPGGSNITTAAGDVAEFTEYASGDWKCNYYTKATGQSVVSNGWTYLASQAATSGTSKDFTIPAGATDVEVTFVGVSTNGTSNIIIQLGDAGGVETSSYNGISQTPSVSGTNYTTGYQAVVGAAAADLYHGAVKLSLADAAAFLWAADINISRSNTATNGTCLGAGSKALSAELTTVRVTMANGTDAFDAGTLYCRWR